MTQRAAYQSSATPASERKKREKPEVKLERDGWPKTGLLRVDQIIGPGRLPISKSQFWAQVHEKGLEPVKLSPRVTCFWVDELRHAFFPESAGE